MSSELGHGGGSNQIPSVDQTESSQLQFTVLYGSHSAATAHCYLLEISGVKILLDCGWDSSFDPALLEPLERVADKVSLVLVSHANLEHLGALPYAYKHFKLTAPCYLTSPVLKLGQLALYDAVLNNTAPYTLDEVDVAVSKWTELKYKQPGTLTLQNQESIVITPHASGRTLGGAVWSIIQEPGLSVLYASDILQRRERFVDGLDLGPTTSLPKNPTLLIQDVIGLSKSVQVPQQRLEQRDSMLIQSVLDCLRKGGDVLIPVDSCSRVLEILLVLDEEWTRSQLQKSYELVLLTRISSLLDMASSHVEWTSRRVQEMMDTSAKPGAFNPLRFGQVAIVDSFEDAFATSNPALRIRPPRVVICAGVDMERSSFSREVFAREISHRPNSMVLLPCESFVAKSVASQLISMCLNPSQSLMSRVVTMEDERWVDLEGEELVAWHQRKRVLEEERQRERETEVEILTYERSTAVDGDGNTLLQNNNINNDNSSSSKLLLQRSGSLPSLDRSQSFLSQSSQQSMLQAGAETIPVGMDALSKRKELDDQREDVLTFTYVAPQELETTWDEYGAYYDVNELLGEEESKKGLIGEKRKNGDEQKEQDSMDVDEEKRGSATPQTTVIPSFPAANVVEEKLEDLYPKKKIQVTLEKPVLCQIRVLDFDGRMNGKDLFEFVDFIKPKKLIVVRSTLRNSEIFANECQNKPACGVGLAPAPGECLDIAADSSVVRVRIPDETLQSCPPSVNINQFVVQRLRGRMALLSMANDNSNTQGKRRRVVVAGGELPSIIPVKEGEVLPGDSSDCWFVSKKQEPNWGTIMDRLVAANIDSRMRTVDDKPVLMCGGEDVVVWKPADGRFLVGGPLCDTYFQVRRIIYDCFALV